MGAEWFETVSKGKTAQAAFEKAQAAERWENGHGGYTGTIAEKPGFVDVTRWVPADQTPQEFVRKVDEEPNGERSHVGTLTDDKWGPAGVIDLKDGSWLFFGWASS